MTPTSLLLLFLLREQTLAYFFPLLGLRMSWTGLRVERGAFACIDINLWLRLLILLIKGEVVDFSANLFGAQVLKGTCPLAKFIDPIRSI